MQGPTLISEELNMIRSADVHISLEMALFI